PALRPSPAQVLVTTFDAASLPDSLRLAADLRAGGLNVEWFPEPAKLDRQLKYADATGARCVAILGPDELAKGQVTLKNLATRSQVSVARADVVPAVKTQLSP